MNATTDNRVDILLHEVASHCQQLLSILQHEYQAVSERDYSQLMNLAQNKQILVERLTDLDAQVHSHPATLQHQRWPALRNMLQQCQLQNTRNGQLLNRSYQLSRETLGVLTGQRHTDATYSANGIQQSSLPTLGNVTA